MGLRRYIRSCSVFSERFSMNGQRLSVYFRRPTVVVLALVIVCVVWFVFCCRNDRMAMGGMMWSESQG